MKEERLAAIKQQALRSIGARANNPNAPGMTMVAVTPHEALEMVEAINKVREHEHHQQAIRD